MMNFIVAYEVLGLIAWLIVFAMTAYTWVISGFSIKAFLEQVLKNINTMDIPKTLAYAVIWPIEIAIASWDIAKCIWFLKKYSK